MFDSSVWYISDILHSVLQINVDDVENFHNHLKYSYHNTICTKQICLEQEIIMKLLRALCVYMKIAFTCKNQMCENEIRSVLLASQLLLAKHEHSCSSCVSLAVYQGYNSLFLSRLIYDRWCGFKGLVWLTWGCSYLCCVCLNSVQWIKIWRSTHQPTKKFPIFGQGEMSIFWTDSIKLWVHVYLIFASFLFTSIKAPKTFFIQVFPVVSTQFLCTSSFHSLRLSLGCSAQIQHY